MYSVFNALAFVHFIGSGYSCHEILSFHFPHSMIPVHGYKRGYSRGIA